MIDRIIWWSLRHRLVVVLAALALLVGGTWVAAKMPVDVFPDLTAPTVTVVAEAHGMAAQEVETLLTYPIEAAMNGASGVRRVRSQTSVGIAVVSIDFAWGTDIHRARQVVSERLQLVSAELPPGLEPPVLGPVTSVMGDILFVGLTSKQHSPMELRTAADWTVARRILAIPGVAQVIAMGGEERQYQVLLDPRKLDAYEVTADDVAHALETANENTSAGFLLESGQEHLIRGIGRVQRPEDITATMVTHRDTLPVLVGDLGEVRIGPALARGDAGVNGEPGVVVGIRKQPGANTLALSRHIEEALDDLSRSLPEGMTIHPRLFRQADFIEVAVDNVSGALRDGAILVMVIVLVFLMSWRATIVTAIAIPLSLLAAITSMWLQGVEINTMTLGGMAIAVGALVDDAIIDVENVARRLRLELQKPVELRRPILEVVFAASKEIRTSIVFATLIIVLVFTPLFFLSGVEGRLLRPLGVAYAISLTASLVVALTVTPVLCSWLLPRSRPVRVGEEPRHVAALHRGYRRLLDRTLTRWRLLVGLATVALAVAVVAMVLAGRAFLPSFNEGALTVSVVTLPGTSLEESNRLGQMVERILLRHHEVVSTARRTGRAAGDEHAQPVNASEVDARLVPGDRSEDELLAALRRDLAAVPGTNVVIGQPIEHRIDHMLSGTRASIAVKIFGPDLHRLGELAEKVKAQMAAVDGVVDLAIEQQADVPVVTVDFHRRTLARHGLSIETMGHEIETAFRGRTVGRIIEDQAIFDLVVRYDTSAVDTFEALREARVGTPEGARIPLHVLAEVRRDVGPNVIHRENVQRKIVVMCNVAGRDVATVVDEIRARVHDEVPMPDGYRVDYGGQFESAEEASRILLFVGLAVLVGIGVLLFMALGSLRDTALVLTNLPLALIGGVAGVWLSGGVLSVASIIGFITLFGIATRNGIMMVTHFQHLATEERERDPLALVRRGATERLSPILMTALASALGLLPLAVAIGEPGSEIQAPMAIVIMCGLFTSTALNMILVPALYLRFGAACRDVHPPSWKATHSVPPSHR